MTMQRITTSVAFYFEPILPASVPPQWLDRVLEVFTAYKLSPILFTASGGPFLYDDCYVFDDTGRDIILWNERLPANKEGIVTAIHKGEIQYLGLDSPRENGRNRSDSRAKISLSTKTILDCYFGLDSELIFNPVALARFGFPIVNSILRIRYAIGYQMPLAQNPASYASGFVTQPILIAREEVLNTRTKHRQPKSPDELWRDELIGKRRHLTGLFRGAYPASILSEAHLRSAELTSSCIGTLSELDPDHGLWLWELSDAEILEAQKILESRGVLVSQAKP
jgi:hypothetical protein